MVFVRVALSEWLTARWRLPIALSREFPEERIIFFHVVDDSRPESVPWDLGPTERRGGLLKREKAVGRVASRYSPITRRNQWKAGLRTAFREGDNVDDEAFVLQFGRRGRSSSPPFSFLMASATAANAIVGSASSSCAGRFSRWRREMETVSGRYPAFSSSDRRDSSRGSLVLKATRLLGPPSRFEASKLEVVFLGEDIGKHQTCASSRTYTLRHCDWTANMTLAVSNQINFDQLRRWQAKLQSDDVVAEWKIVKEEKSLHVHCYVSGANPLQDIAAEFRYHIFCKELPLVLKAVVHGDSLLFEEHPELMEAPVWVYFHSKTSKFNRVESWGPLKSAMERTLDDQAEDMRSVVEESFKEKVSPKSIIHALFALLL